MRQFFSFLNKNKIFMIFVILFNVLFIFWLFSKGARNKFSNEQTTKNSRAKINLLSELMVIFAAVMQANNVAKKSELQVVKDFLYKNFPEQEVRLALEQLRNNLKTEIYSYKLNQSCRLINHYSNYATRITIINLLFQIAIADGEIDFYEYELLKNIRINLGIYLNDFENIKRNFNFKTTENYSYSAGKNNYTILGISPNSNEQDIKKAFREKAKLYHPDKYSNCSEKEKQKAKEMFQEINNAYEEICKARNIK